MKLPPQLRIAAALTMLAVSAAFVADLIGVLPRPEEQVRAARQLIGETLAVQLSSLASTGDNEAIDVTLQETVARRSDIRFAGLYRSDGTEVSAYGDLAPSIVTQLGMSSFDTLVVPIYAGQIRWGEAQISFTKTHDWGLRLLGVPAETLTFLAYLLVVCMASFTLFLRKALAELNPTKAVPERVQAAFEVLTEGVTILDESGRIVLANGVAGQVLGEAPETLIGKSLDAFSWDLSGEGMEQFPWQHASATAERVTGMPLRLLDEGRTRSLNVNAGPIEDGQGHLRGVLITFDDVTPLEAKNQELASMLDRLSETQRLIEKKNRDLEHLATRDPLTGCFNRRAFLETYDRYFVTASAKGGPLTVMMLDIDHFKQINDNHGHMVGDLAIKAVATTLLKAMAERVPVGRYGGEEFIIALPGLALEGAMAAGEQLRRSIARLAGNDDLPLDTMTVSIGVADLSAEIADKETLIDRADKALYSAKQGGRNRVCAFDPNAQQDAPSPPTEAPPTDERDQLERTSMVQQLQLRLQDIRKQVKAQANELSRKSLYDDFTGLPNRLLLQDRLGQIISRYARQEHLTAVISIGFTGYRQLAESGEFDAAQEMIRVAAERLDSLSSNLHSMGVSLGHAEGTCSRTGESELALLVVDVKKIEAMPKFVELITQVLEDPFKVGGQDVRNDVNCGIALYPKDGVDAQVLIRNAILARHHAERRRPRSDSVFFAPDLESMATKSRHIAVELRKSLKNDRLDVNYQPKVDAVSQEVIGFEALARWHHPEMGHISPTQFITIAENIGAIAQITDWVWTRVCEDIAAGHLGDLPVSINVSPIELHDTLTGQRLLSIVRKSGVSPTQVEMEITESSLLDNLDTAREILADLREAGMRVLLDDFGTAYSSLNILLSIPVDVIKIDRCFVSQLQDISENRAVVRAIVQMAGAMGKRIVAEGVETVGERDCLVSLGCREMQGFLYAKPLARKDLRDFVNGRWKWPAGSAAQAVNAG